jgi:hypothetical protein
MLATYRHALSTKSLAQRLAPLETGVFLPANSNTFYRSTSYQLVTERRHTLRACFGLGFASSCVAGGVALLILLFDPVEALNVTWSMSRASAAPSIMYARVAIARELVSPVSLMSDGRQLWWKLPALDSN